MRPKGRRPIGRTLVPVSPGNAAAYALRLAVQEPPQQHRPVPIHVPLQEGLLVLHALHHIDLAARIRRPLRDALAPTASVGRRVDGRFGRHGRRLRCLLTTTTASGIQHAVAHGRSA